VHSEVSAGAAPVRKGWRALAAEARPEVSGRCAGPVEAATETGVSSARSAEVAPEVRRRGSRSAEVPAEATIGSTRRAIGSTRRTETTAQFGCRCTGRVWPRLEPAWAAWPTGPTAALTGSGSGATTAVRSGSATLGGGRSSAGSAGSAGSRSRSGSATLRPESWTGSTRARSWSGSTTMWSGRRPWPTSAVRPGCGSATAAVRSGCRSTTAAAVTAAAPWRGVRDAQTRTERWNTESAIRNTTYRCSDRHPRGQLLDIHKIHPVEKPK
jgi:hypothetical protein